MGELVTRVLTARWKLILLGVVCYVAIGQVVRYIPNPMVPDAIIALNMVVVVIFAYFTGPWEGALIGALGTAANFLVKLTWSGVDVYELAAIIPHAVMGASAGWFASRSGAQKFAVASTIFVGHGLNLLAFLLLGLLPWSQFLHPNFWSGLLAETTIDLIFILLVVNLIENFYGRVPRLRLNQEYWRQHGSMAIIILVITLILLRLYLQGAWIAAYLFIVPLLLTSLTIGYLEAWILALLMSLPLGAQVVTQLRLPGWEGSQQLVALIITFNLVALAVGELASELKRQKQVAQEQADELQKAYFALKEADQLKAEMIQNVSHELRTPLSLIVGYAELLATGMLDRLTPEQRRAAETIYTHGRHLAYLVEQVTILHQVEQGQISQQPTSLVNLVRACIEKRQVWAAGHKCPLHFNLRDDIPLLELDAEYMERAIDALIDNAVKFSPDGGDVEVALWREHDRVYLAVRDHGIGIDPKDFGRLFKRFSQVDASMTRRYGGMGTGLALVKEVVRAHHGDVWFESTVGVGSVFGFWLPLRPTRLEDLLEPPSE